MASATIRTRACRTSPPPLRCVARLDRDAADDRHAEVDLDLADTTIRGASGAAQHATTFKIDHVLRRYLTLTGTVGSVTDAYVGVPQRDATTTFGLPPATALAAT